jgi:hypothetical protein
VLGLLNDVSLDQEPGHLVAQGGGDLFEFRKGGAAGQAIRIDLAAQFAGDLAQATPKLGANGGSVLAHVDDPLQVVRPCGSEAQSSAQIIRTGHLIVQTMSCARTHARTWVRVDGQWVYR